MTYDETYIYVASSATKGILGIRDDKNFTSNNKDMHSYIYRIKRKNFEVETKRLTIFGDEIHCLALIGSYGNLTARSHNPRSEG